MGLFKTKIKFDFVRICCAEIKTIDEPEARASLIWILGEYIEDIENAEEIIRKFFLENFVEESS